MFKARTGLTYRSRNLDSGDTIELQTGAFLSNYVQFYQGYFKKVRGQLESIWRKPTGKVKIGRALLIKTAGMALCLLNV